MSDSSRSPSGQRDHRGRARREYDANGRPMIPLAYLNTKWGYRDAKALQQPSDPTNVMNSPVSSLSSSQPWVPYEQRRPTQPRGPVSARRNSLQIFGTIAARGWQEPDLEEQETNARALGYNPPDRVESILRANMCLPQLPAKRVASQGINPPTTRIQRGELPAAAHGPIFAKLPSGDRPSTTGGMFARRSSSLKWKDQYNRRLKVDIPDSPIQPVVPITRTSSLHGYRSNRRASTFHITEDHSLHPSFPSETYHSIERGSASPNSSPPKPPCRKGRHHSGDCPNYLDPELGFARRKRSHRKPKAGDARSPSPAPSSSPRKSKSKSKSRPTTATDVCTHNLALYEGLFRPSSGPPTPNTSPVAPKPLNWAQRMFGNNKGSDAGSVTSSSHRSRHVRASSSIRATSQPAPRVRFDRRVVDMEAAAAAAAAATPPARRTMPLPRAEDLVYSAPPMARDVLSGKMYRVSRFHEKL